MLSFSEGAVWFGPPSTWRGTICTLAMAAAVARKWRREFEVGAVIGSGRKGNRRRI